MNTSLPNARWTEINKENDVYDLKVGMDFRHPRYRRAVFLKFYEFHIKYKSHPGAVYYVMPALSDYYGMNIEQKLWFAFINGCSQNVVTTNHIFQKFPDLMKLDLDVLNDWWNENHQKFKVGSGWDTDRKYFKLGKTGFPQCVAAYKKQVLTKGTTQAEYFLPYLWKVDNKFSELWNDVRTNFMSFGRLSAFSYIEYLKIMGVDVQCDNLFLDDIGGSKSHRNGLCKVLGRDDLDWHDGNTPKYTKEIIEWLEDEAKALLYQAQSFIDHEDVGYFTLESTLCCYKSWFRPNRRYPNVYNDMFHDRIKYYESVHGSNENSKLFWDIREKYLPDHLRLECNPRDPGLSKLKQNHFRETGEVIMMEKDFPCFMNNFNSVDNSLEGFFV